MGHLVNHYREYQLLQRRMDNYLTTVPPAPELMEILQILFTPEEARLASQLPTRAMPLSKIATTLGKDPKELEEQLSRLAMRGLVVDVQGQDERYFALAPVLGGVFEFVMMRVRDNLPIKELARLFDAYIKQNPQFVFSAFDTQFQFARTFVREESIREEELIETEILDWERVSSIIDTASDISLGLCACRHNNYHLGKACSAPQETCISLNGGALAMIQMNISKRIDKKEAMNIVEHCKKYQLVQIGDNVQKEVTFLCNCCSCCCTLLNAIRRYDIRHAIKTSNYIMQVDKSQCKGCGTCEKVCPVQAIQLKQEKEGQSVTANTSKQSVATVDETLCLGCGVCTTVCKSGALRMKPRAQRVLPPETAFDRMVLRAMERGKLGELILECPESLSHRAVGRILYLIEKTPLATVVKNIQPLRSIFFQQAIKYLK